MQKEAENKEIEGQRRELLTKYAATAEEMLEKEHGKEYEATDVEKLAETLIDLDIKSAEEQEKVAEYVEAGKIMARSFVEELNKKEE